MDKYPGWAPRLCLACKNASTPGPTAAMRSPGSALQRPGTVRTTAAGSPARRELNLTLEEVLQRFSGGPTEGVFTDGACSGNPGPGGWGTVLVRNDRVISQQHGSDPSTTNNRMELTALVAGYQLLSEDAETTIYSDSQLCVRTINEWAAQWERRGWRRKGGPVKNLDLVKQVYALAQAHPNTQLRWIKAHDGSRWNEYADSLATAYLRDKL